MRRWFITACAALTIAASDGRVFLSAQIATAPADPASWSRPDQEAFLIRAKVVKVRNASKGVTGTRRVTLEDGGVTHDASVQTIDDFKGRFETPRGVEFDFKDTWKFNVAAYLLDKQLGLDMIPATVERRFQNVDASYTWWVDDVMMDEETRLKEKRQPPSGAAWFSQTQIVRVFDELIHNNDRNMGNLLISSTWRVWMIDHSRAFRVHKKLKDVAVLHRVERHFLQKLRELDPGVVKQALKKYLTDQELDGLLGRRDLLVAHFDRLGEKALYTWPVPAAGGGEASVNGNDPNTLTAQERREGWRLLFDGTSLGGWRGYKQSDAAATRWRVEDGWLTLPPNDGKDTRGARDLISSDTFDRFELAFEWRVAEGANSGVKYFVLEDLDAAIGHEYQIIDDERHPDAKIGPERQTGAFYDVLTPSARRLEPAGKVNQGRIVVRGPAVEHWLNRDRILTYELDSAALRTAIVDSKFKDVTRFGKLHKAHILLQDHGDQVWYRNVKIRPLVP